MKNNFNDPIERIAAYEARLDRCAAALDRLEAALEEYRKTKPLLTSLERYYTGPQWREDLAADEAGLLPPDLKRGVLSEDAVWDLLERSGELEEKIKINCKKNNKKQ